MVRKLIRENWLLIVLMLVAFGARSSLADHYVVPTGSMEPTLLPGDRVLVDKTAYGEDQHQRIGLIGLGC